MIKDEKPFFSSPKTENQISAKKGKKLATENKTEKRNIFYSKNQKRKTNDLKRGQTKTINLKTPTSPSCFLDGGYTEFQVTGMIEWWQNEKNKNFSRPSGQENPQKTLDQKFNPKLCRTSSFHIKTTIKSLVLYYQNYTVQALPRIFKLF